VWGCKNSHIFFKEVIEMAFTVVDQLILGNKRANIVKCPASDFPTGEVTVTADDCRLGELDYVIPMLAPDVTYYFFLAIGS